MRYETKKILFMVDSVHSNSDTVFYRSISAVLSLRRHRFAFIMGIFLVSRRKRGSGWFCGTFPSLFQSQQFNLCTSGHSISCNILPYNGNNQEKQQLRRIYVRLLGIVRVIFFSDNTSACILPCNGLWRNRKYSDAGSFPGCSCNIGVVSKRNI